MSVDYHPASSIAEAIELLAHYGEEAHLLAGGTSLAVFAKLGLLRDGHFIGLRGVEELRGISVVENGVLEIGAMTTHRQAERAPELLAHHPALAEAFGKVATVRIRNQATVGGSLAHADPSQDPPPMLLALGCEVVVAGPGGERFVQLDDFFTGFFETALRPDEVIVRVRVPRPSTGTRAGYVKFLPRSAEDYATVGVAISVATDGDGVCKHIAVGFGALGSVPLRGRSVEAALRGQRLSSHTVEEASALVRDDVAPLEDGRGSAAYKREIARICTAQLLLELIR